MRNRIFVSYNFNDREIGHSIKSMSSENGGQVTGEFVFVSGVSSTDSREIYNNIKDIISSCNKVLFVVGNNNHNSPWINKEVDLAISKGLEIFVVRIPGTYGGIPNNLPSYKYSEIVWNGYSLARELNY